MLQAYYIAQDGNYTIKEKGQLTTSHETKKVDRVFKGFDSKPLVFITEPDAIAFCNSRNNL